MNRSSHLSRQAIGDPNLDRTVVFLTNYLRRAIRSRSYGLADLDRQRDELLDPDGSYKDASIDDRSYLEAVMYLQLFDRVHLMIADFGALCDALLGELTEFPKAMAAAPSAKSILRRLDRTAWYALQCYGDLGNLGIVGDDQIFVDMIRNKNIAERMKFVNRLTVFIDLYQHLHAKQKHGNLLLYGLDELWVDGERVLVIPVVYNTKQVSDLGYVIVTERIYRVWQQLHNDLIEGSLDLVRRTLLYIERGGVGLIEHSTMFEMLEGDSARLETIVTDANVSIPSYQPTGDARFLDPPYDTIRQHVGIFSSLYEDR